MNVENEIQTRPVEDEAVKTNENTAVQNKSYRKALILLGAGIGIFLLVELITGVNAFRHSDSRLRKYLDLGMEYLEEMEYEQALNAFDEALSIEAEEVDAYIGIVETCIRTNEFDRALEYAQEGYEATGDERLEEKIDMLESGSIYASNGWVMKMPGFDGNGNMVFWHEFSYDISGRQASVAKYNELGVQEQYLELVYDEKGRALTDYGYSSMDGNLVKCTVEYDGNSYRETWYEGLSDIVSIYVEGEMDSQGNILREAECDRDGNVLLTEVYDYNADGSINRREYYNADNELTGYWLYIYDENGRCQQRQVYDSNNELYLYFVDIYDEQGNYLRQREYDAYGNLLSDNVIKQ